MTQEEFVKAELKKHKEVSRNLCLQNNITRLGAIIYTLKDEIRDTDWYIEGKWAKTEYGKDYVYYLKRQQPMEIARELVDNFNSI